MIIKQHSYDCCMHSSTGGNIDVNVISQVIECGLLDTGRRIRLSMDIQDRPGTLSTLIAHISTLKANV